MTSELPGARDDFKLITGIGPAIEGRLHAAGIVTFSQLATLSVQDIASYLQGLAGMSPERIREQEWVRQARELAQLTPLGSEEHQEPVSNGQHYATFTVELLLEETNEVRRTRVVHVQSRDTETWAGWDAARLVQCLVSRAELRPERSAADSPEPEAAAPQPQPETALAGTVKLRELQVIRDDAPAGSRLVPQEQPFDVRLVIEMENVEPAPEVTLRYKANLHARGLADGRRYVLGDSEGEAAASDPLIIQFPARATGLDAGAYRLEADVTLSAPDGGRLLAAGRGTLVQMY